MSDQPRAIRWHDHHIQRHLRAEQKSQKPCMVWFTGLSGAGKSTIANAVDEFLYARSKHTYLLDGDNVRHGLNKDLGFTDLDRVENIRRIGEVGHLMVDAGLIVLSAFISPFKSDRQMVRSLFAVGEFIEVHVATDLSVCEKRDPKGLYRKARAGEIKHFTGIDSPYEQPDAAELVIDAGSRNVEQCAEDVIAYLDSRGYI